MPWLTILLSLISYFVTKKKTNGNEAAALGAAALVGAGSYYVTHETDWGRENLGFLDGVDLPSTPAPTDGTPAGADPTVKIPSTTLESTPGSKGPLQTVGDVLTSWGPTGTAAVIGTTAAVTSGSKWLIWGAAGIALLLLLRG